MNCPSFRSAVLASLGACALTAVAPPALLAQTPQLEELSPETGWFLRFGGFIRTGIKLSLRDRAIPAPAFNDPNGGFNYDNGFVKPDNSGSAKDTYNWGYTGAPAESYTAVPQYTAGSDHLTFQRLANAPRIGDVDLGSRSLYGGQMTGGIEVSHFKLAHRDVKWGFEVGYAYSTLSASASARTESANATLTTDTYSLTDAGNTLVPPQAPFTGSPAGPNFLLTRTVGSSTSISAAGTSELHANLDANVHSLRVGPWFETPIARRLSAGFSVGYVTTLVDAELRLQESTTYAGNGIPGNDFGANGYRRSEWVPGAYAQLRATYMFTDHIGVFVGGEAQWSKNIQFPVRSREAEIRFGAAFGGILGLNLSF